MIYVINKYVFFVLLIITARVFAQYDFEVAFTNLNFTNPLGLQNANDGTNRIFVVEQIGKIKVFPNEKNINSAKVFLDITNKITSGGETGLLGLAFHPDYKNNGYFYVNYTAPDPLRTVISRFSVSSTDPDFADESSEQILLTFNQPYSNHNGGCLAFGPDGYLYISTGDGGSGGDPQNNAQNIKNFLGKILRIDVDITQQKVNYGIPADNPFMDSTNTEIKKEIFAWGLRNTWKFSFDSETGLLWAGDVGQDTWEEIDIIRNGKNYGWRCYEANHEYNTNNCNGNYEFPIWEYSHSQGFSVTGGYVYRGSDVPELYGKYIYGDYVTARVWALDYFLANPPTNIQITTAPGSITSFGIDENQELFLVSFNGKIYKFIPTLTNVNDKQNPINNFYLYQNFPNPFNPATTISYSVPSVNNKLVSLKIFDILGNEVATLVDQEQAVGIHYTTFNSSDYINLTSGIYFCRLEIGDFSQTRKMILLK